MRVYNSANNTLYLAASSLYHTFTFINKEFASKIYKNLPRIDDVPYGSVWKWGEDFIVMTKNKMYRFGLKNDTFINGREANHEIEEGVDEKGNNFYIFSSTNEIFGRRLLYHKIENNDKLDVILATLDKL